jgi:hypothetical protein
MRSKYPVTIVIEGKIEVKRPRGRRLRILNDK